MTQAERGITRERLAELLNEDLSREYQAIIAYVVYSQVLKGAEYMNIADQLEKHAGQELQHALTISRQIDYLGKMPTVSPKPVKTSDDPKQMLRSDLENENETVRNYRERIRQCEALGEFAMAEQIGGVFRVSFAGGRTGLLPTTAVQKYLLQNHAVNPQLNRVVPTRLT